MAKSPETCEADFRPSGVDAPGSRPELRTTPCRSSRNCRVRPWRNLSETRASRVLGVEFEHDHSRLSVGAVRAMSTFIGQLIGFAVIVYAACGATSIPPLRRMMTNRRNRAQAVGGQREAKEQLAQGGKVARKAVEQPRQRPIR